MIDAIAKAIAKVFSTIIESILGALFKPKPIDPPNEQKKEQ